MRLVLAVLFVAFAVVPATAQQARPGQPAAPNPPSPSGKPSQSEEVLRQRLLLREKFNKGWEVQTEDPREKKARCRSEARKQFSAMHPLKRRKFQKECMAQARR